MELETRDFGKITVDENRLISFVEPLYGFDGYTSFALLSDDEMGKAADTFLWLQSAQSKDICFVLVDPIALGHTYFPTIDQSVVDILESNGDNLIIRCIACIKGSIEDATINMKSPIIINKLNNKAIQVIVDDPYEIHAPLLPVKESV